jgi:DNA polymerase III sliding clamp (beta) subunit (PCNA family)
MTATATKPAKSRKTRSVGVALNVATLSKAIREVEPAVPARSPKPVLQNVLLADGHLTGTDLELRISVPLPEATGPAMLLPFAKLKAIVATLRPTEAVTITAEGTSCRIESGGGEWTLPMEDAAEFPAAPETSGKSIGRLPAEQLVSLVNAVRFSTDSESSRYALGAVCIEFSRGDRDSESGLISFIATDGRRMSISAAEVASQDLDNSQTLVPSRAIAALVRLAAGGDAVQMLATDTEFVAIVGEYEEGADVTGTTLHARLTEGRFPRWQDVDKSHGVAVSTAVLGDLLHAIRMAEICTSETSKSVTLTVTPGGIDITAQAAEAGQARVHCELVEAGHPVTVKIDPHFAEQWLNCGSFDMAETVRLEAIDPQSAVVLRCGDHCRTVIMPMAE